MRLTEWKDPRIRKTNSERKIWSQMRILNALKNKMPAKLGFNALLKQISRSDEEAGCRKMSTRTLAKNLGLLVEDQSVAKIGRAHYITKRGFQKFDALGMTQKYSSMLNDTGTILIGQEPNPEVNTSESYSVMVRTKERTSLSQETEQEVAKVTNNYLRDLGSLLAGSDYEIKVQATITDKKRSVFSAYRLEDSDK